jgi:hypothetical protein
MPSDQIAFEFLVDKKQQEAIETGLHKLKVALKIFEDAHLDISSVPAFSETAKAGVGPLMPKLLDAVADVEERRNDILASKDQIVAA